MKNQLLSVIPAGGPGDGSTGITNPLLPESLQSLSGQSFLSELLSTVVTLILIIGSIAFFFMLLIGALGWLTSGGDKASVESSRNRITQALVGLVLLFAVFAIVKVVEGVFGIKLLTIDIAPLILGN